MTLYESCTYVSRNMAFLYFCVCVTAYLQKHVQTRRDKKGRTVLLPTLCKTSILASDVRNPPRDFPCLTFNFCLFKPCAMCLISLHFQPCAGSEPDCNCCLSNKYTYMQLRSPEVTRMNFHLTLTEISIIL